MYASNLLRVRQTLDIVLKNNEYAVEKLPEIIFSSKIQEMDFGLWEGKNYREISEEYPEDVDRWANDWENSRPTGGESFKDFCTVRIKNAFFEIVTVSVYKLTRKEDKSSESKLKSSLKK